MRTYGSDGVIRGLPSARNTNARGRTKTSCAVAAPHGTRVATAVCSRAAARRRDSGAAQGSGRARERGAPHVHKPAGRVRGARLPV
jgi:hypothetical protein